MPGIDWRHDLMIWHPRLFATDGRAPSPGYPHCERGWQDTLARLCRRIEIALGERDEFEFVRIKSKLGILRIDWDAEASEDTEAKIAGAVDLATARSASTCELCGAEARLHDNAGWLETRCAQHAVGEPVVPRYGLGFENVRRLRRWRGQADMYYASYDRDTDTLTEVPPPGLQVE